MGEIEEKALKAINKPAEYGLDIDINSFSRMPSINPSVTDDIVSKAREVGIEPSIGAAQFYQIDRSVFIQALSNLLEGKAEVLAITDAVKKYDWVKKMFWGIVNVDKDKYTAQAALNLDGGYFIRIYEGEKVEQPIQTCLFTLSEGFNQNVHNFIVAEPGSKANIITGCTVAKNVNRGLHIGISEFHVMKEAKLTYTMIHDWGPDFHSRPRTGVILEDEAVFISNYINLKPVGSIQTFPSVNCRGKDSIARINSIIYGTGKSTIDIGGEVILEGEDSKAEIISRTIAAESATIYARGRIIGRNASKGHLECIGLLASDSAKIKAIPELFGFNPEAELSHEAAIAKIKEEEIVYLMARGLTREEAETAIYRGFMDVSILGLPKELEDAVNKMIDSSMKGF